MKSYQDLNALFKIPLRNIWRNRRRTLMTMSGICVAAISLILFGGYIHIIEIGLKDNAISREFGHFQIARKGYFNTDSASTQYLIPEDEFRRVENQLNQWDEVDFVNIRLNIVGIIGNFEKSTTFMGICGLPDAEILMSPSIISGEPLTPADPTGIIIGQSMAKKLDVKVGSSLLLFFSSEGGSQEAINVTVRGIYKGILQEQESALIYIPLESAWNLMLEKKIHRILVFLKDKQSLNKCIAKTKSFIQKNHLPLEVKPWHELAVYYQQIINMFKGFLLIGGVIIALVIVFNISNTMFMVINERIREIGTLRAMGDSRAKLTRLLMLEGFYMGIIGVITGSILAFLLIPAINALNLNLPPGPGQQDPIIVQIAIDWNTVVFVTIGIVTVSVLASFLPALRATRIKIVDALHQL